MVIMRGIVTDIVPDEIDPSWRFLIMRSESGSFLVALGVEASLPIDHLVGATVSATGIANVLPDGGKRKFKTPQLTVPGLTGIAIDTPAPKIPLARPESRTTRKGSKICSTTPPRFFRAWGTAVPRESSWPCFIRDARS